MAAQAFHFKLNGTGCFAQGHTGGSVSIALAFSGEHATTLRMPPAEARAMAVALEAAAVFAENVLATGLGESAVAS